MHVDDEQRQLEADGQADRLALEGDTGTARRRDAQMAAVGRAEGGADAGDLVLGLQGAHAEVLVLGQLVEDVRRRRDGVRAEEQRELGQLGGGDQAPRGGGVAVDRRVDPGGLRGGVDGVAIADELGGLAEGVAGLERGRVGVTDLGLGGELGGDPVERGLLGTGVHPGDETEREEVLAALGVAGLHAERFAGLTGERGHRDLEDGEALQVAGGQRVVVVARLGQAALVEGVDVDDDRGPRLEFADLRQERRGVHGDEHVGGVAVGGDVMVGDVDLEGRDAGDGARRCADLRRVLGQGHQVVAEHGAGAGEPITGELHPVAGVTGEADDDPVEVFGHLGRIGRRGHANPLWSWRRDESGPRSCVVGVRSLEGRCEGPPDVRPLETSPT